MTVLVSERHDDFLLPKDALDFVLYAFDNVFCAGVIFLDVLTEAVQTPQVHAA